MDASNIKISELVSMLDKNQNGYYTSNDIFDGRESISSRYSLKASSSNETHYFIFSMREGHTLCYLSLRLANKKFDHRNSNHIELFDITVNAEAEFNDTAPKVLKAVCRESTGFNTTETEVVEALFYLSDYIPEKLKQRIIFSFDDTGNDNSIVSLNVSDEPPVEEFYKKYAREPQAYYKLFNENINDLYSKGYYKHGPVECLMKAVKKIDDEREAEERRKEQERKDEERRKEQEREAEERRKEQERLREELKKQQLIQQQLSEQNEEQVVFNNSGTLLNRSLSPNGDVVLFPKQELKTEKIYTKEERITQKLYPPDDKYFKNPLYFNSLIDFMFERKNKRRSSIIWDAVSLEQILQFAEYAAYSPEIVEYAEPEQNSRYYDIYKAVYAYFVTKNIGDAGLFLGLQLWFENTGAFFVCQKYGLDYKEELKKLCENLFFERTSDNDSLRQKIHKEKKNREWEKILRNKIKFYEKRQ